MNIFDEIVYQFELDECASWIRKNGFAIVAIQIPNSLLQYSSTIVQYLEANSSSQSITTEFYVIVSNCCSVDYISPLHLGSGRIQAIIRFGRTCLATPAPTVKQIPTLFAFTRLSEQDTSNSFIKKVFSNQLDENQSKLEGPNDFSNFLILCDTQYSSSVLRANNNTKNEIAKLFSNSKYWEFTSTSRQLITSSSNRKDNDSDEKHENENIYNIGEFWASKSIDRFEAVVYVGEQLPLFYRVLCLYPVWHLNPKSLTFVKLSSDKELRKRVALIEKTKKAKHVGFVFTHSYPNVNEHLEKIEKLIKNKRLKLKYTFISLVQTTDECKLGNFGTLDALIIVNNCLCSNLIDQIRLHVPLISSFEFEIVCGQKIQYGGINWNQEEEQVNEEDCDQSEDEKEENDNFCKQLMELQLGSQTWYGLQVNAGQDPVGEIKQGLSGIASSYQNEPIRLPDQI